VGTSPPPATIWDPSTSLDSIWAASCLCFDLMPVQRELRRRVRADQSQPRFEPCLPRLAQQPPAGTGWIHEIKHDGFRILAHRDGPN